VPVLKYPLSEDEEGDGDGLGEPPKDGMRAVAMERDDTILVFPLLFLDVRGGLTLTGGAVVLGSSFVLRIGGESVRGGASEVCRVALETEIASDPETDLLPFIFEMSALESAAPAGALLTVSKSTLFLFLLLVVEEETRLICDKSTY
jgi:hypothetical protein